MNAFDSIFDKRRKKFAGGHLSSYRVHQHLKKSTPLLEREGKTYKKRSFPCKGIPGRDNDLNS